MDDLDRAKEIETQQRELAIQCALKREAQPSQCKDDDGTIICIDCASPIPLKRLHAKPDAARCIDCKNVLERQQKLRR